MLAKFRRQKGPLSTAHTEVIQCDQLEPTAKTAWGNLSPSRKIPDCMDFARKNSQHNGKLNLTFRRIYLMIPLPTMCLTKQHFDLQEVT